MRVLILAGLVALAPAATAQAPGITIEDDVSRENAVKCTALRSVQFVEDKRVRGSILLSLATSETVWKAYLDSQPQYGDRAKLDTDVQARIAAWKADPRYADNPLAFLKQMAGDCEPFEIRTTD